MTAVRNFNPFSSRFVSPSSCSYVHDPDMDQQVDEFARQLLNSRCVEIVGPHGCGKSTLAFQIANRLRRSVQQIRIVAIQPRPTSRFFPTVLSQDTTVDVRNNHTSLQSPCPSNNLTIVDGAQFLSPVGRFCLTQSLIKRRNHTIFTLHRPSWSLRPRIMMRPSLQHFRRIALNLAAQNDCQLSTDLLETTYSLCEGNYRKGLSLLYDEFATERG